MIELESHIDAVAAYSRSLWRASQADDLFIDPADAAAFRELAGRVEEHAANARGLFERMTVSGKAFPSRPS